MSNIIKSCSACNKELNIDKFPKNRNKCKDCINKIQREYMKEYYNKNKEKLKEKNKKSIEEKKEILHLNEDKLCSYCNIHKSIVEFRINRKKCKDCEKLYGRKYNKENKEVREQWKNDNMEKYKELQRNWTKNNRERINNKTKERLKDDPEFKLITNCRRRIRQIIKNKTQKTNKYIGTSSDILKKWIEFCFTNKMTWENYGSYWHIDHVLPISLFNNNDEELKFCLNWKNLTPYEAKKNLSKNNNIINEQVTEHIYKLKLFINTNNTTNDDNYIESFYNFKNKFNCETTCCSGTPLEL